MPSAIITFIQTTTQAITGNGETIYITSSGQIASTSTGISGNFSANIVVLGSITSFSDGIVVGASGLLTTVYVGDGASVVGGVGFDGMHVNGTHVIENHGSVFVPGTAGWGIHTLGAGLISNFGAITGGQNGVYTSGGIGSDVMTTYNYGSIVGRTNSYFSDTAGIENVVNAGVMQGEVRLGSGTGSIFDSSLGQVFGDITGGNGGNTIIGGRNGGRIFGGAGNDVIRGNTSAEAAGTTVVLSGGGGLNVLYAGAGDTTFVGGTASLNAMFGSTGRDIVDYSGAGAPAQVNLALHVGYVNNVIKDTLYDIDGVIGTVASDILTGDDLANFLTGNVGFDVLTGGGGADRFIYRSAAESTTVSASGYDTIVDFQTGVDKLDLTGLHTTSARTQIFTGGGSTSLYTFGGGGAVELAISFIGANAIAMSDIIF